MVKEFEQSSILSELIHGFSASWLANFLRSLRGANERGQKNVDAPALSEDALPEQEFNTEKTRAKIARYIKEELAMHRQDPPRVLPQLAEDEEKAMASTYLAQLQEVIALHQSGQTEAAWKKCKALQDGEQDYEGTVWMVALAMQLTSDFFEFVAFTTADTAEQLHWQYKSFKYSVLSNRNALVSSSLLTYTPQRLVEAAQLIDDHQLLELVLESFQSKLPPTGTIKPRMEKDSDGFFLVDHHSPH